MKLFYAPNACSMGIHLLLEEIGEPYQLEKVDFASGAQYKAPFVDDQSEIQGPAAAA